MSQPSQPSESSSPSFPPPAEPRPDPPAQLPAARPAVVARGAPPSEPDQFFLKKQWELIAAGPETLRQGGQRLMTHAFALSGVYLAVLGLGDLAKSMPDALRYYMLAPYIPWIVSMALAYKVTLPQRTDTLPDAPDALRAALIADALSREPHLRRANVALITGVALMVTALVVAYNFIA